MELLLYIHVSDVMNQIRIEIVSSEGLMGYCYGRKLFQQEALFGRITNFICNISNTSDSVSSGYPNTEKRVENTTRSGVFLTKFEVFG